MAVQPKGLLVGKQIFVHDGGRVRTVPELRGFMRRFSTCTVLRGLGAAYRHIWTAGTETILVNGSPISGHFFPYLAMLSIEVGNDHRAKMFDDAGLLKAVEMLNNLKGPLSEDVGTNKDAGLEHMLRQGQHNFHHQMEMRHLFPRAVLLLRDVWATTPAASGVNPLADLQAITDLTFDQILWLGQVCTGLPDGGVLRPSMLKPPADTYTELAPLLTEKAASAFFKWLSASYEMIRTEAAKYNPPRESFDPYRFNPLTVNPLVRPDVNPDPRNGPIYLVPCRRLIIERVTQGLYYDLVKHHMGDGRSNPFKTAFGHVFQNYVGLLLEQATPTGTVHHEWKYGAGGGAKDTPDWIVIEGNRAVLIEVKQSGIFLDTKMWGELVTLRKDLKKTIGHAVQQLNAFEGAVAAGVSGLERMRGVSEYEHLVICFDAVPWANSVVRDEIAAIHGAEGITETFHVHVAAIHEFEYVLGRCWNGSLFQLLREKRANQEEDQMDFVDWMGHHRATQGTHGNPFLSEKFNELNANFGIPPIGDDDDATTAQGAQRSG